MATGLLPLRQNLILPVPFRRRLTPVSDGAGGTDTGDLILTLAGDDEAPVNAVPGAQTVAEDTALAFTGANLISVTDPDTDLVSTQLTVTNGILNVTLSGGATINPGGNGSADLTVSGTQADINATLASLTYQGNLNFNGGDTLTVLSTDATTGTALTDSDTVAITVTAMNDDPVAVDDGPITVTFNTKHTNRQCAG